ncbi:MAG: rod shape-determining protein MreC [Spirochaetaceae bacterium]|jgi:rod shape-determining protein MreC|nr:rod shape-determining protein MreC [Spirochaetaceae bacterium]
MIAGDSKKKRRVRTDVYVFVALSLISFSALFFSARSFVTDFRNAGLSMYSGLRESVHGLTSLVSRMVLSVWELAKLKEEYDELTARVVRYEQLERTAADIRQENNRLREQLGFSRILSYRHVAAEIIGTEPDNLFSAFVINRGKKDGIGNNMPVIAYQNGVETLVGKVIQAAQYESMVMPLYDSSSYISSRLNDSRIEGIVEGQGSHNAPLLMRFVRRRGREEEIKIGEAVITSGLGGVFPRGIIMGRVSRVLYQDNDTSIEIELESQTDFSRLEYVFVIDTGSQTPVEETGPSPAEGEERIPGANEGEVPNG